MMILEKAPDEGSKHQFEPSFIWKAEFEERIFQNIMEKSTRAEQSQPSPVGRLQLILTLISWVVGLAIVLFTNWASIPLWARYAILGLIAISFLVTLVLGIIPASRLIKTWADSTRRTRHQRQSLMQLAELIQEARSLFDPHLTCSLRNYVESVCNAVVQNETLHPQIKRLAERLHILGDWHWSLLTFADTGFRHSAPFVMVVRDITMFYRNTADVVRELATMKMPEDGPVRAYDDQRRMMKEKYNLHIGSVERVLERIAKTNPELHSGGFHRF